MMSKDMVFSYYFVAFIDILGTKDAFNAICKIPATEAEDRELDDAIESTVGFIRFFRTSFEYFFDEFKKPSGLINQVKGEEKKRLFEELRRTDLNLKAFSDFIEIFVSLKTEQYHVAAINGIYGALGACSVIKLMALALKHAIRGGIEVGLGLETPDGEIYGPALNEAYRLESKVATYPRIVVGDGLINFLRSYKNTSDSTIHANHCKNMAEKCLRMITRDLDGFRILDFLGSEVVQLHSTIPPQSYNGKIFTFQTILADALDYVKSEQSKCRDKKDSKLALNYFLLHHYMMQRKAQMESKII